jgi:hypothetical protein
MPRIACGLDYCKYQDTKTGSCLYPNPVLRKSKDSINRVCDTYTEGKKWSEEAVE